MGAGPGHRPAARDDNRPKVNHVMRFEGSPEHLRDGHSYTGPINTYRRPLGWGPHPQVGPQGCAHHMLDDLEILGPVGVSGERQHVKAAVRVARTGPPGLAVDA